MRATLKEILSPDIPNLRNYQPENPQKFGFPLQLLIGPRDVEGMESFQLTVCTPMWLAEKYTPQDILIGRHLLIVFEYDFQRLLQRLRDKVESCHGETWQEVAEKVGRLALWEFEDYTP
jgi:hypothetical protein